jgi:hypothetical protein
MTDNANKPIDDSKEELTESELDQVAGGRVITPGAAMVEKPTSLGGGRTTVGPEVEKTGLKTEVEGFLA